MGVGLVSVISGIVESFGIYYTLSHVLFMSTLFSLVAFQIIQSPTPRVLSVILVLPIGLFQLWLLQIVYASLPVPRIIFGIDVMDFPIAIYVLIFVGGFLGEVSNGILRGYES
ncbi:hypothetical protein [Halorubrum trueperi]|uniref:Uncharacterized protein n=1 Tax=Halorubrum trueperi TaxID=2004704 RepID=A0ABD5UTB8_9EURY